MKMTVHKNSPVGKLEQLVLDGWEPDTEAFERAGITYGGVCHYRKVGNRYMRGKEISSALQRGKKLRETGGKTEVFIDVYPPVLFGVALAEARCNTTDKFDRRFGEKLALARAIDEVATRYEEQAKRLRELLR